MNISFTVPLPPRELSSNGSHGHWQKESRVRSDYRGEVCIEALAAQGTTRINADRARISLVFCIKGGRKAQRYQPRDVANALAAFKSGIDGIVDSNMVIDDSAKHLELGKIAIDNKRGPFVFVEIEVLE